MSFHHWYDAQQLRSRVEQYRQQSDLPLLLQEVGYHSWAGAPQDPRDEATQAEILASVIREANEQDIIGWVVWTAFDFVPRPGQPATYEHYFGLWRSDLTPKPALDVLPFE